MLPTAHNTTGDPPKKWISFTIGVWSNFESRYYDDGVLLSNLHVSCLFPNGEGLKSAQWPKRLEHLKSLLGETLTRSLELDKRIIDKLWIRSLSLSVIHRASCLYQHPGPSHCTICTQLQTTLPLIDSLGWCYYAPKYDKHSWQFFREPKTTSTCVEINTIH
jgi:hypothetical protein